MPSGWRAELDASPPACAAWSRPNSPPATASPRSSTASPPRRSAHASCWRGRSARGLATSDGVLFFRARDSALLSGEWTDVDRRFFVLEPPGPPPEAVDMDALRAARTPVAPPDAAPPDATLEFDYRGDMLTYREGGRVATIICSFADPPRLLPRTLNGWHRPADQAWEPNDGGGACDGGETDHGHLPPSSRHGRGSTSKNNGPHRHGLAAHHPARPG